MNNLLQIYQFSVTIQKGQSITSSKCASVLLYRFSTSESLFCYGIWVVCKGRLKTRDWKTRHQTAGVENAGLENAAPNCRGGKRGSSTVWKAEVSVF